MRAALPGRSAMTWQFDWAFPTVKQRFVNDREFVWNRGKGLGGSSGNNYYMWSKPAAGDINAIAGSSLLSVSLQPEAGKTYCTLMAVLCRPFSRGTVHATSSDAWAYPTIDPHLLENDFDVELLVQGFKYIRSFAQTEPFQSGVVREMDPGVRVSDDDQQIRDYIKNTLMNMAHAVGSCSMLPRENQGVVDPELKVYGTTNVRVVDLSILPLHTGAHPQATVYMIAEKATDIIRASRE
ncbi:GMC oxidoreductase-domain-containing protein [Roridomyces roridus]|uniref:GMC oxidoreductase-domain-containing protein n=1 Tax=Roridomyces roridus TaxID=1738132 RepID=A0AAD7FRT0_9AGAR|nr:GMC oxidoreductase-domain-containing protein [Roridomyces roridus]